MCLSTHPAARGRRTRLVAVVTAVLTGAGFLGITVPAASAAPLPPTGVEAIASPASVRLVWTPPDDGQEVAGYRITASTGAVFTAQDAPVILRPLGNGVPVSFRVAAVRAGGAVGPRSAPSNTVTPQPATSTSTWTGTGRLRQGRVEPDAVRLRDGTVLAVGGSALLGDPDVRTAERYDPATGRWTVTGSLDLSRTAFTTTLLRDGRVLVTGGFTKNYGVRGSTRLYNPATGRWSRGPRLRTPRAGHTATLLPNGKVLVVGGVKRSDPPVVTRTAELYNPKTDRWTRTGSMSVARSFHSATRLKGGNVLAASGTGDIIFSAGLRSTETYHPATGRWAKAGNLQTVRTTEYVCCQATVLLPSGKVLLAGGYPRNGDRGRGAELFDPATRRWTQTGNLRVARTEALAMVRLPGGRVLALGGSDDFGSLKYAEIYSEPSGRWTRVNDLRYDRAAPLAIPLRNGKVLVAGGAHQGKARRSSELFTPSPASTHSPAGSSRTG